jgi:integrase
LGRRTVKDLTTSDVRGFLRDVTAGKSKADVKTKKHGRARVTGGRGTASRTMGLLGGILSFAVDEGYRPDNPAHGVIRPADQKRKARLDDAGYRLLGEKLREGEARGEAWQAIAAIRILALTGCRRGEIEHLKRTELDLAARALLLEETKTGASIRPLGRAASDALSDAAKRSNEELVLPAVRMRDFVRKRYQGLGKAWKRIVGGTLPGITPHGLRHSFASVADDLGFTTPTIRAMIGHATNGVTEGYIHKLDPALIAAADRVSNCIAAWMGGEERGVVVPLPVVAAG